jgi:hypothetical protein
MVWDLNALVHQPLQQAQRSEVVDREDAVRAEGRRSTRDHLGDAASVVDGAVADMDDLEGCT